MPKIQAKILVKGFVQGVAYRLSAKRKADAFGLTGYAKNLPDGSVEILAQGEKENIEQFIAWCREGPPAAGVEKVEVSWGEQEKTFDYFDVL